MKYHWDCRKFNGYKPCEHKRACQGCSYYDPVQTRVLVLSLEAMGAVLRSTCLLKPILRKHPKAHITWITKKESKPLLDNNPFIDRLLFYSETSIQVLSHLEFDLLFSVDKSLEAGALAESIKAKKKYGFGLTKEAQIRPFTEHADYQFDCGLDDQLKFFVNKKAETQQLTESMNLSWKRDPYVLEFTAQEQEEISYRRQQLVNGSKNESVKEVKGLIGFNTGCSTLYPYKKLTIEHSIELIQLWRKNLPDFAVVLLGGREDIQRQQAMKEVFSFDSMVLNPPCDEGLRSGCLWMASVDLVFSGCSLGAHIAIACKKKVVMWFGVTCSQEIDLYDCGHKLHAQVDCAPCWKKTCKQKKKCYEHVSLEAVLQATKKSFCL